MAYKMWRMEEDAEIPKWVDEIMGDDFVIETEQDGRVRLQDGDLVCSVYGKISVVNDQLTRVVQKLSRALDYLAQDNKEKCVEKVEQAQMMLVELGQ